MLAHCPIETRVKIVGLMAARNEQWVLGLAARAALMWLDGLVILDHASTDMTREIAWDVASEFPGRVVVLNEDNPVWEEMRHRQRMLDQARAMDATHICYIDADEVLTGDLMAETLGLQFNIRHMFRSIPPNSLLQIPWLALRGSIGRVHTSGPWALGQNASFGFVDDPRLHWSSEKRGGYDFHHRQPMGKPLVPWTPLGGPMGPRRSGLMHLQFVSGRRLRAKQALYKMTEVLRWPGREPDQIRAVNERYNLAVYGGYTSDALKTMHLTLGPAPLDQWWKPYPDLMKYFDPHMIPWQEAECLKLLEEHGPQKFAGLDLFGIGEISAHAR